MHYQDGTQAKIGDIARGKGSNSAYLVQGIVIGLIAGTTSCNLRIAIPRFGYPIDVAKMSQADTEGHMASHFGKLDDGRLLPVGITLEYGTVADFELIHRPVATPNDGLK